MDNISIRKRIVDTDVVNNVTYTYQSVITRVVIRFLWHDVIHLITGTSYDKLLYILLKFARDFYPKLVSTLDTKSHSDKQFISHESDK